MYYVSCAAVFILAYLLNTATVSIGYHRGLAHKSVAFGPRLRGFVLRFGIWITGLDPKGWVVMHRMHHAHSDTPLDPHSPSNVGLAGIALEQLRSYKRTIRGLAKKKDAYTMHAKDLDFGLHAINFGGRWFLPYALHGLIAAVLVFSVGGLLGGAYFFGMMSHPIQGGLVNAFGHAVGGRNFQTDDNSRNNLPVGWLVLGEGYQNNHHRYPLSASFSHRTYEIDMGYWICVAFEKMGALTIARQHLIPAAGAEPRPSYPA